MAFADKKGINIASPFKLQAEELLDVRQKVDTIAERDELVTIHAAAPGLRVFVKANKTTYIYNGSGWDALISSANIGSQSVTTATKLSSSAGSATQPIYFSNGKPAACSYTLGKSVPSNAVFTDTTYSDMKGATSTGVGTHGLVPAPSAGAANRYLRSDGTWAVPPDTNTTYSLASFGITASAAEINYTKGVTSSIQTQLNGKASSTHTHSTASTSSAGFMPKLNGSTSNYLRGDGAWATPPNTNTDTKVTQTAVAIADYTNWRSIPWGSSNSASEGFSPTTVTDVTYTTPNLSFQPSTGTLKATVFKGSLSGNATSASSANYATSAGSASSATTATQLSSSAGSATQPVYFSGGKPVACSYTLGKSVPSNAVFTDTNTWIAFKGATTSAAGTAGYAPAPSAGAANRYLRSDGTWSVPPNDNTTYSLGSFGISASATELNYTKGVTSSIQTQLNGKASSSHTHNLSAMINSLDTGTSTPVDGDYYVTQYAGGGTTNTEYLRRPVSALATYVNSKLAAVARSGSYSDLSGRPSIPSVGNGTVTITQNGTTKGSFTMNQSGNTTIALTDNNTTYSLSSFGISASATELNYTKGVTSSIQTQLNGKASTNHTHSYLPLSGGTLTGDIVIPIDPSKKANSVPIATTIDDPLSSYKNMSNYKTFLGSAYIKDTWYNIISTRHRNGMDDGVAYGMILYSGLTYNSNLHWLQQTSGETWTSDKTILDSSNYIDYAPSKTGSGASGTWGINISGSANSAGSASKATSVVDYNDGNRAIKIGYSGSSLDTSTLAYFAGYDSSGNIKDTSVDVVKSKLGLSNYASASHSHSTASTSSAGFMPKLNGSTSNYLRGDGAWATPPNTDTDTKVTNVASNTSTAYITGTTSSSTNTGTQIFDTGVYLTSTAGRVHTGSLEIGGAILTYDSTNKSLTISFS